MAAGVDTVMLMGVVLRRWRCWCGGHVVLDRIEERRGRQGERGWAICGGALKHNRGRLAVLGCGRLCLAFPAKEGGASREEAL